MPVIYTLKHRANSRRLRLSVSRDGEVTVTVPKRARASDIEAFVSSHEAWIQKSLERFSRLPKPAAPRPNRKDFALYKKEALELVKKRLEHFNAHPAYGFKIGKVTVRNQKSRWGSCSKSGNLSFSYRLAQLPPDLADYVVVHELCHLGRFDHSKAFWDLVMVTVPDWKEKRKMLR